MMTGRYVKPSPVEEVQESSIYTYWKEALVRQKCQFGTNILTLTQLKMSPETSSLKNNYTEPAYITSRAKVSTP